MRDTADLVTINEEIFNEKLFVQWIIIIIIIIIIITTTQTDAILAYFYLNNGPSEDTYAWESEVHSRWYNNVLL